MLFEACITLVSSSLAKLHAELDRQLDDTYYFQVWTYNRCAEPDYSASLPCPESPLILNISSVRSELAPEPHRNCH